jgi:hypothetical protein
MPEVTYEPQEVSLGQAKDNVDYIIDNIDSNDWQKKRQANIASESLKIPAIVLRDAKKAKDLLKNDPNDVLSRQILNKVYDTAASRIPPSNAGEKDIKFLDALLISARENPDFQREVLASKDFQTTMDGNEVLFKRPGDPQWKRYNAEGLSWHDAIDWLPAIAQGVIEAPIMGGAGRVAGLLPKGAWRTGIQHTLVPGVTGFAGERLKQEAQIALGAREKSSMLEAGLSGLANMGVDISSSLLNWVTKSSKLKRMQPSRYPPPDQLKASSEALGLPVTKGQLTRDVGYRREQYKQYEQPGFLSDPGGIKADTQAIGDGVVEHLERIFPEGKRIPDIEMAASIKSGLNRTLSDKHKSAQKTYDELGKMFFQDETQFNNQMITGPLNRIASKINYDRPTKEYLLGLAKELEDTPRMSLAQLNDFNKKLNRDRAIASLGRDAIKYNAIKDISEITDNLQYSTYDTLIKAYAESNPAKRDFYQTLRFKLTKAKSDWKDVHDSIDAVVKHPGEKVPGFPGMKIEKYTGKNADSIALSKKIWDPKNPEKMAYIMEKHKPEFEIARRYHRGEMLANATASGEGETKWYPFKILERYRKMGQLEKNMYFEKSEQKVMNQVDDVLTSLPKNFNPSGTSSGTNLNKAELFANDIRSWLRHVKMYAIESPKWRKTGNIVGAPFGLIPVKTIGGSGLFKTLTSDKPATKEDNYYDLTVRKFKEGK